jgi:hypothetical protein
MNFLLGGYGMEEVVRKSNIGSKASRQYLSNLILLAQRRDRWRRAVGQAFRLAARSVMGVAEAWRRKARERA